MMLLCVLCFAHMVPLCGYNVFVGGRVMSSCNEGGVIDENGGMVGRRNIPVYAESTAVHFGLYGSILRSIPQE